MIVSPPDPAAIVRDLEEAARAGDWTVHYLSPCAASTRPWFHRAAKTRSPAPRIYLSAGIHGDEISGPFAVLEMLRRPTFFDDFDVTIFPILNPDGIARGIRGNAAGIDLNRDYRNTKSTEILSHIEVLETLAPVAAAMCLHEDFEGIGAYLYELNEEIPPTLGAKIIAAMGKHVPIDLRPEIEEVIAHGGVLSRRDIILKLGPIEDRLEWPEAIYLRRLTGLIYTTETPLPFPLEKRIRAQIAAVETLLNAFRL
jgi:murein peptide amidase A